MTTRDTARRRPGNAARTADASRRVITAIPAPTCRSDCSRRRTEGRGSLPRRARYEDPGTVPRRAGAGRLARTPGLGLHEGFLRNYALYLGLDPDDVLLTWRAERGDSRPSEPVIVVPRPIQAPSRGFTISPGLIVALLLVVAVAAFAVYLGVQLLGSPGRRRSPSRIRPRRWRRSTSPRPATRCVVHQCPASPSRSRRPAKIPCGPPSSPMGHGRSTWICAGAEISSTSPRPTLRRANRPTRRSVCSSPSPSRLCRRPP